jgi:hypothetical protein
MNRQLLPAYLKLAESHNPEVKELLTIPYRKVPIHSDLFSGSPDKEKLYIIAFSIKLAKSS